MACDGSPPPQGDEAARGAASVQVTTTEWAVELSPTGIPEAYCPLDDAHGDHRDQGMVTSLTIR